LRHIVVRILDHCVSADFLPGDRDAMRRLATYRLQNILRVTLKSQGTFTELDKSGTRLGFIEYGNLAEVRCRNLPSRSRA